MSPRVEAFEYWTHIAYKKPEARALATRLGLDVPQGTMQGYKCGLIYPMRRLVISGEDSSANMAILFGSSWESVDEMHKECRKQVLMAPPLQGSPMGKMSGFGMKAASGGRLGQPARKRRQPSRSRDISTGYFRAMGCEKYVPIEPCLSFAIDFCNRVILRHIGLG